MSEFSLTKAVDDISHHGYAQFEALKESRKTASSLQATLSAVEKKCENAERELRSQAREILILEAGTEQLEQRAKVLRDRCTSISKENAALQMGIGEAEEEAQAALGRFGAYRRKMEAHRAAVLRVGSHAEAGRALEERRALVGRLSREKEELRGDLDNPNGNTAQKAKREINSLKEEISAMKEATAEGRELLRKELETHTQIKKDIQIQNRRFEAIVKRFRRQLSRAQADHRRLSEEVDGAEGQLAELQRRLESAQDSAVGAQ